MRTISTFVVITAALAALPSCARRETAPVDTRAPIAVNTTLVRAADESDVVEAVGSLRSTREAVIAGKVMGTVTEIRKNAGDAVKRGEVVVVIDSRDIAGQIDQAKGALAQARAAAVIAETNFSRFEQLFARGAASQLELDQARYQYETTKGAVAQAEGAVQTASSYESYAEIPAPFDGRVVDRLCEVGDMAAPGRPLLKIEDADHLRLDVALSAKELAAASVGATVKVVIPALGDRELEGTVSEIVPAADPTTHSFLVKIDLPRDASLRSGLYGRAMFAAGIRRVVRVPRSAVVVRGGLTGVFLADENRARFRLVTISDAPGDSVEVLAGLSDSDRLIVGPGTALEEGVPIEVRQ
ncbi:MAG: efflux RND transporter periplasmic adaptor subunit [Acidobacteriota bacterium]